MLRTHTCGELSLSDTKKQVTLCGWVQRIRDKNKIIWIDLRDRYGITQLTIEEAYASPSLFKEARQLGREFVVAARGEVVARRSPNPQIATGAIELRLSSLEVISPAQLPPFIVENKTDGSEQLRMHYRYLDLRRPCMQENLLFRQKVTSLARQYLQDLRFIELETPMLIRSTPEGARDFIVPSRREKGHFYALPQSPQQLKQLFMVAGMDRYFQFARCFRDEDLRADRQPEFTQLDCELSFVEQKDVMQLFEGLTGHLFRKAKGVELGDFPVLTYQQAMERYGSDKPDLRWALPLVDVSSEGGDVVCPLWKDPEVMMTLPIPNGTLLSRKKLDALTHLAQEKKSKLSYIKYTEEGLRSALGKWYGEFALEQMVQKAGAQPGDLLLVAAGAKQEVQQLLGFLRLEVIQMMDIPAERPFAPLWVVDFPLLEWDEQEKRYQANHHPFTAPRVEDLDRLTEEPSQVKAQAYDLIINGTEIAGGSVRIHQKQVQEKVFATIGIKGEKALKEFGALLHALEYGAPVHAGIAFGWDRLCLVMNGGRSIRDYIPFPKNNMGRDVMLDTPSALQRDGKDKEDIAF